MTTHRGLGQVSNLGYRWTYHLKPESGISGESPPPPPRTFFGRDELIEKVVDLAEKFIPVALIGAGGVGKTSITLAVLHHNRIKRWFGDDRRFIRCDKFPASCAHLLRRLFDVIGMGVENPENLTSLRTFLSSKKMLIVLDNAESILDPQVTDAQELYAMAEELSRFDNICICITSRISTTPPDYKRLKVPTLSMDAARDTFYRIYGSDDRSNQVNSTLEQLDFHPLSIALLATVAHQNKWDMDRLTREWEQRRTSMLQTRHNKSLAAAIELSLTSPLFRELGPDARALLGVVAFFPQGVDENNFDWLFPTISNRTDIFDKFCIFSLTYRSNGFVTMLAPLRNYLSPKDPKSSSLLCATKERYLTRMSVKVDPDMPNFGETRWIMLEDVNIEHLLDVFTTIDKNSDSVWKACADFMAYLCWHKNRPTILKPKIEGLPDDHSSKPGSLLKLSRLFYSAGNYAECKRLLTHALKLWRERGDVKEVAQTLEELSDVNRQMDLPKEGIQQAKEAMRIYERLGDTVEQGNCLVSLAFLLHSDKQFDAAESTAFHAIDLLQKKGKKINVHQSHQILGNIYRSKRETEQAIHHFEVALEIASSTNWHTQLFWIHHDLAQLFHYETIDRDDDAQAHIEQAKSHAVNNAYYLGYAMELQAWIWYHHERFEEARSEALCVVDVYEKLAVAKDLERCRKPLHYIERDSNTPVASGQSCEFL